MAKKTDIKQVKRVRRKRSIRKKLSGTAERPRLSVFRSAKHVYVQVVDDRAGHTLVATSTLDKALAGELEGKNKREQAKIVGAAVAKRCIEQEIKAVAFDRNGFIYHGRVAALADGAREGGLEF